MLSGDPAAAAGDLARLQSDIAAGHARTTGPAWWLASHVPWLGSPLDVTRMLADEGRILADQALPQIVAAATTLDPHQLRVAPDQVDLHRVVAAQPSLARAVPIVDAVQRRVTAMSGSWLGAVAHGRSSLLDQLDGLATDLHDITVAADLAPAMLGADGPRHYLVVFEGDSEVRGVGGILGGWALLDADRGRMHFVRYGSDRDFGTYSADVDLGSDFNSLYSGDAPTHLVTNADLSPHFPYAAQIWGSMAEQALGVPIDGVIAADPEFLAQLVSVTGPVSLPDGTKLTSDNLVQELDVDVYRRFNDDSVARKAFFVDAAQAVAHAVFSRHLDTQALLRAFTQAADQRRLVLYSSVAAEESQLAAFAIGGTLPETTRPFVDVVLNNASATKLDGYVHESVTYRRESCAAGQASVTVTLTNDAPTSGLPSYVTDGLAWTGPHVPGTDGVIVGLYGTSGSLPQQASVDGKPAYVASGDERGHPVTTTQVLIPPGQTTTVVFTVDEPAATGPAMVLRQPLANEPTITVDAPTCPAA